MSFNSLSSNFSTPPIIYALQGNQLTEGKVFKQNRLWFLYLQVFSTASLYEAYIQKFLAVSELKSGTLCPDRTFKYFLHHLSLPIPTVLTLHHLNLALVLAGKYI